MGTQKSLTTEQLELLIMIDEIEEFDKKHPGNIPAGGIKEVLDSSNVMGDEDFSRIASVLEDYGYLHNGDELTVAGKNYIEFFQEYLEQKAKDVKTEHRTFALVNIEQLNFSLLESLGKISILENVGEVTKLLNIVVQAVKDARHK